MAIKFYHPHGLRNNGCRPGISRAVWQQVRLSKSLFGPPGATSNGNRAALMFGYKACKSCPQGHLTPAETAMQLLLVKMKSAGDTERAASGTMSLSKERDIEESGDLLPCRAKVRDQKMVEISLTKRTWWQLQRTIHALNKEEEKKKVTPLGSGGGMHRPPSPVSERFDHFFGSIPMAVNHEVRQTSQRPYCHREPWLKSIEPWWPDLCWAGWTLDRAGHWPGLCHRAYNG